MLKCYLVTAGRIGLIRCGQLSLMVASRLLLGYSLDGLCGQACLFTSKGPVNKLAVMFIVILGDQLMLLLDQKVATCLKKYAKHAVHWDLQTLPYLTQHKH